tara:strand:+ start:1762 stop:2223 length:462 start_codon:yes stop_codon:yes gene_type:complete
MKISKLLGALGNLDKIAEGIKNNIFKRDDVEAIAKLRWAECKVCPLLDRVGKSCAVPNTQPCCSDCGCSLSLKLRSLSSGCPKGRWEAVMDGKQENTLVNQWLGKEKEINDAYIKAQREELKKTWGKDIKKAKALIQEKKKGGCKSCNKNKKK